MNDVIRRLTPTDASLLRELRMMAISDAPEAFGSTLQETAERSVQTWRHMLRPERNPFFIFEVENVIGGLIGGLSPSENSVAQLVSMWVSPQLRGRQVSDQLVEHVIRWAVEAGACRITLHCTEGNLFAERLYARHGFSRTGEIEVRERDNAVEFEMALDLIASGR
jgi:GNAT superfamily N-acetyltransferase